MSKIEKVKRTLICDYIVGQINKNPIFEFFINITNQFIFEKSLIEPNDYLAYIKLEDKKYFRTQRCLFYYDSNNNIVWFNRYLLRDLIIPISGGDAFSSNIFDDDSDYDGDYVSILKILTLYYINARLEKLSPGIICNIAVEMIKSNNTIINKTLIYHYARSHKND